MAYDMAVIPKILLNYIKSFTLSVDDKEIDAVIDSMFKSAGMADKQTLDIDDFNRLLRDYKDQLDRANLNFAGTK